MRIFRDGALINSTSQCKLVIAAIDVTEDDPCESRRWRAKCNITKLILNHIEEYVLYVEEDYAPLKKFCEQSTLHAMTSLRP